MLSTQYVDVICASRLLPFLLISSLCQLTILSTEAQLAVLDGPSTPMGPPPFNTIQYIVRSDGSDVGYRCTSEPASPQVCFFESAVNFQQTCSPACYWGGLCRDGQCVKQRNSCVMSCPENYACSYGE